MVGTGGGQWCGVSASLRAVIGERLAGGCVVGLVQVWGAVVCRVSAAHSKGEREGSSPSEETTGLKQLQGN